MIIIITFKYKERRHSMKILSMSKENSEIEAEFFDPKIIQTSKCSTNSKRFKTVPINKEIATENSSENVKSERPNANLQKDCGNIKQDREITGFGEAKRQSNESNMLKSELDSMPKYQKHHSIKLTPIKKKESCDSIKEGNIPNSEHSIIAITNKEDDIMEERKDWEDLVDSKRAMNIENQSINKESQGKSIHTNERNKQIGFRRGARKTQTELVLDELAKMIDNEKKEQSRCRKIMKCLGSFFFILCVYNIYIYIYYSYHIL